jgi:transposase InsO family protein
MALSRVWPGLRTSLHLVQPETVLRWHRKGFRLFWAWKSRPRIPGRPTVPKETRDLICKLSRANHTWGAPRIQSELAKLGIQVSQSTVARYMDRTGRPPSQTWRTFLNNHTKDLVAVDFFTVPTATFQILFVFLVLSHDRRKVLHFNVTDSPSANWTARQITQAFPYDNAPRFLLRDRDCIYGKTFRERLKSMDIAEVITAARSPWQNPYVERMIGTIRRDCLDHVIVLNRRHLKRILREYLEDYYHPARTHLSLGRDSPFPREVEPPDMGAITELPVLGGLHHLYTRRAA